MGKPMPLMTITRPLTPNLRVSSLETKKLNNQNTLAVE